MMQFRAVAAGVVALVMACGVVSQRPAETALEALREGNRRFVEQRTAVPPLGEGMRRSLARGQSPGAIVVCCADSRVPPELIFNTGLGELFVVRLAGTCVDAEALASIEYAAEHLGTQLCVVLTHESCGALQAGLDRQRQRDAGRTHAESEAMQGLLERLEPAVRKALAASRSAPETAQLAEEEQAQLSADECLRRSPVLRHLHREGRFRIAPARYHLRTGVVEWLPDRPRPTGEAPAEMDHAVIAATNDSVPPHVALRMLQAGHRRFLSSARPAGDLSQRRREDLTHGQRPLAIVVACADSRVSPELLFDAGLGEVFVVRLAGNVINDSALASIEYAAAHTGASLCIVLGHSSCGALTAAAEHPAEQKLTENMRALLGRLEPSVERARSGGRKGAELVTAAIRANALRAVAEARSRSGLLRGLEKEGRFALLAAVYDLPSGDIQWLDEGQEAVASPTPAATKHGDQHDGAAGHAAADHGADLDWAKDGVLEHAEPAHASAHAADPGGDAAHHAAPLVHGKTAQAKPPAGAAGDSALQRALFGIDPILLAASLGLASLAAATWLVMSRKAG